MNSKKIAFGLPFALAALFLALISSGNVVANGVWHSAHVGGPDACVGFELPVGCDKNFSFVAIQFEDLSVTGQFTDRWFNSKGVHGNVDCLYVYDNFAFVGGPITDGDFVGNYFFAVAVDKGKTANDPADQISFTYVVPPPSEFLNCEEIPWAFPFVWDDVYDVPQGQVKVK